MPSKRGSQGPSLWLHLVKPWAGRAASQARLALFLGGFSSRLAAMLSKTEAVQLKAVRMTAPLILAPNYDGRHPKFLTPRGARCSMATRLHLGAALRSGQQAPLRSQGLF